MSTEAWKAADPITADTAPGRPTRSSSMAVPDGSAAAGPGRWVPVCGSSRLRPEVGVAARLDELQVAVFRTWDGEVLAVGHRDPYSGANVMARGIVGTSGSIPTVASPVHKQVFDLRTGRAVADPEVELGSYPARIRDGNVQVRLP